MPPNAVLKANSQTSRSAAILRGVAVELADKDVGSVFYRFCLIALYLKLDFIFSIFYFVHPWELI